MSRSPPRRAHSRRAGAVPTSSAQPQLDATAATTATDADAATTAVLLLLPPPTLPQPFRSPFAVAAILAAAAALAATDLICHRYRSPVDIPPGASLRPPPPLASGAPPNRMIALAALPTSLPSLLHRPRPLLSPPHAPLPHARHALLALPTLRAHNAPHHHLCTIRPFDATTLSYSFLLAPPYPPAAPTLQASSSVTADAEGRDRT